MADSPAETTTQQADTTTTQQTAQTQPVQVDYEKISEIVTKGTQQKENAVLKGYFEQQGLTEDEIKQAITSYKTDRAKQASAKDEEYGNLKNENEALKAQILSDKINSKATNVALDMGIDKNAVQYVLKLADMSKVTSDNGDISEDDLKTAIETVLNDVPAFKNAQNSNDGFKVGADSNKVEVDKINILRKAAGLAAK